MNNKDLTRIKTTLGKEEDSYYVYMLCENVNGVRKPFYIGKGIEDRIIQHEISAEQEFEIKKDEFVKAMYSGDMLSGEDLLRQNNELIEKIREEIGRKNAKINELGAENVVKVIVKWGLTKNEAFMAESALINAYCLTDGRNSLTNIVNGHMSPREKANRACSTKARTLEEFLKECAVEERYITEIKEPILFLNIKSMYPKCLQLAEEEQEKAIYDACRASWVLNEDMVKKVRYVFALYGSQVVGIYPVNEDCWKQRREADESFPSELTENRQLEYKYCLLAGRCSTFEEMKSKCDNFDEFMAISKIGMNSEKEFDAWKKRYYFNRVNCDIPENILSFKNCILIKPDKEKIFGGKGHRTEKMYNFYIRKGRAIIKVKKDYRKSK